MKSLIPNSKIMNKKTLVIAIFAVGMLFTAAATKAQGTSTEPRITIPSSVDQEGVIFNAPAPVRVNSRALRHFNKAFAGRKPVWFDTEKVLQAKLYDDSMRTVVGYAKSGRWLYEIRTYKEKQLAGDIRHEVRSEYYDYSIDLINEVRTPERKNKIYLIHLVNNMKHRKVLRYSEEGLELVKSYYEQ